MICNRCGGTLPLNGAVCPHCGVVLSKEQIEFIKENKNNNMKKEYLSDHFGVKKDIDFRSKDKSYIYAYIFIFIVLVIVSVILFLI